MEKREKRTRGVKVKKMVDMKKSYFFLFSEEQKCLPLEVSLMGAFHRFEEAHKTDSEVRILTPKDDDFADARKLFGITQTPAFVIADEPYKIEKGTNPFITFNRPAIEKFTEGGREVTNLINDLHYLLIDKDLLRIEMVMVEALIFNVVKGIWGELKSLISLRL